MAGSQVVLHNRDDAPQEIKDITRNLGLASVVYNETISTGLAVNKAQTIRDLTDQLSKILITESFRLEEYIYSANQIYYLLQNAYYTTAERIQRLQDLQEQAKRYYT